MRKLFEALYIGAMAILFAVGFGTVIYALLITNAIAQTKDYQGADKWQHAGIGFATTGLCNLSFNSPLRCFAASEAYGLAQQIYAIKTNPQKIRREGAYDFLAHTIGASIALPLSNRVLLYIKREGATTSVNYMAQF